MKRSCLELSMSLCIVLAVGQTKRAKKSMLNVGDQQRPIRKHIVGQQKLCPSSFHLPRWGVRSASDRVSHSRQRAGNDRRQNEIEEKLWICVWSNFMPNTFIFYINKIKPRRIFWNRVLWIIVAEFFHCLHFLKWKLCLGWHKSNNDLVRRRSNVLLKRRPFKKLACREHVSQ